MGSDESGAGEVSQGRRELLKALASASGALASRLLLPAMWSAPIVASMSLPAHAECSRAPMGSTDITPDGGTRPLQASTETVGDTKFVILKVTLPAEVLTDPTQYQVVECAVSRPETVIKSVVPSSNPDVSGTIEFRLERVSGTYSYQLRTTGTNTEWVKVTVP